MRTAWGYDVSEWLEPILSVEDFDNLTNGAFSQNPRAEAALKAASAAVRNFCGWHITPALSCTAHPAGGSQVLRLPAGYVSEIESITENGYEVEDYEWRKDGLVRRRCKSWTDVWDGIEVSYTAGYETGAIPDLAEAVCSIASGVLSVSPGVTSESADGVTISYSASAASIAASLTNGMKSALDHYKVVNSHAA